jgi:hypothetical protein
MNQSALALKADTNPENFASSESQNQKTHGLLPD